MEFAPVVAIVLAITLIGVIYLALTRPCQSRVHGHRHWRWSHRHLH